MSENIIPLFENGGHKTLIFQGLSIQYAAKTIGISTRQVYRLLETKQLKSRKIGRRRLVDVLDLRNFYDRMAA